MGNTERVREGKPKRRNKRQKEKQKQRRNNPYKNWLENGRNGGRNTGEKAKKYYLQKTQEIMYLDDDCTAEKVEDEAEWLRNTMTDVLDRYTLAAR
jgi:hypothetical protein